MRFFSSFYRSLFDLKWLKERKDNYGAAWSYFFLFIFLLAGLTTIPLILSMPAGLREVREVIIRQIPDFKAEWHNDKLKIEALTQPYIWQQDNFLLVVDTITTTTMHLQDYLTDKSFSGLLISGEHVEIYTANNGKGRVQYWKDIPDYTINKDQLLAVVNKLLSPATLILLALLFCAFLFLGLAIAKVFNLLLVSLLVLIGARWAKKNWHFKQVFSVGLYALTLPSVLVAVLNLVIGSTGWLYFSALLVFLLIVIFQNDRLVETAA